VLTVLDGWGFRAETKGNAVALARKPAYDELIKKFPNTFDSHVRAVCRVTRRQMGNSEVGHMNMGAGALVHMDITRIDLLIATKQLQNMPLFQQAMERGRARQLHFLGLLSDGGVHSHIQHLFALAGNGQEAKVEKVFVHCFMDGRDTPPNSWARLRASVAAEDARIGCGRDRDASGALLREWTATTAGSASSWPIAHWFTAKQKCARMIRLRRCSGAMKRT